MLLERMKRKFKNKEKRDLSKRNRKRFKKEKMTKIIQNKNRCRLIQNKFKVLLDRLISSLSRLKENSKETKRKEEVRKRTKKKKTEKVRGKIKNPENQGKLMRKRKTTLNSIKVTSKTNRIKMIKVMGNQEVEQNPRIKDKYQPMVIVILK
jgi:hypothetical protein